jgi:hypothetical protein
LPFRRHRGGAAFERRRFLEERLRAPVQDLAGLGEDGLAPADLEELHVEKPPDLLHRVRDRRLALVEGLRRLPVAARLDHRLQRAPLLEGDPRGGGHHRSNRLNRPIFCAFLSIR